MTHVPSVEPSAPIGLRPKFIWVNHRISEIQAAIDRYVAAGIECPPHWRAEMNELKTAMGSEETQYLMLANPEIVKLVRQAEEDSVLNPLGLKLRVAATCDTYEEAQAKACELLCCTIATILFSTVAAVGKGLDHKTYLRPAQSKDSAIFCYIVIVCDW